MSGVPVSTSKVSTVWKRAAEVEWKLKVDLYEFQTVSYFAR
jgi:hypothetical protein